jgi:hypothetical protein
MSWTAWLSRWLPIGALTMTLLGLVDPLEGFPVVLIGGALAVMAAIQCRSAYTRLVMWGFGLAAAGCAAMVTLSLAGGVGATTGRSLWWLITVVPYPVGVVVLIVGDVLMLRARKSEPDAHWR